MTWLEDLDYLPAPEDIDDGFDLEEQELRDWVEQLLPTVPHTVECDRCATPVASVFGPYVPGVPDGVPMVAPHRRTELFVCPPCATALTDEGWRPW